MNCKTGSPLHMLMNMNMNLSATVFFFPVNTGAARARGTDL